MYTKVIDGFHSHSVNTFVRLIVGLSSLDEEELDEELELDEEEPL